jgi:hypothetical protein
MALGHSVLLGLGCCVQTDASLAFKMATHFGLFGGTLLSLGSQNQQRLIDSIDDGTVSGCFALAEVGYGCANTLRTVFRACRTLLHAAAWLALAGTMP